jgi:5-methylcytosine-specific restriction endonuclease McrA
MWNEPMPKWRTARKQYQCWGDGCAKVIAPGARYLDRAIRDPEHSHLRYCQECAEPVMARANSYHFFDGRNEVSVSLELHHVHYRSLGSEQPEDVELLCPECHTGGDEARAAKSRPKRDDPQEGWIVGIDGDYWGKFDPDTIYIVLQDGRNVPIISRGKS